MHQEHHHVEAAEMGELNLKTVPLLLIAGLWGAYNVVLEGVKILDERRDLLLDLAEDAVDAKSDSIKLRVIESFQSDFVPVSLGQIVFCLIFMFVMISVPYFIAQDTSFTNLPPAKKWEIKWVLKGLCWLCAALALLGVIGFWIGLIRDHNIIMSSLGISCLPYFL